MGIISLTIFFLLEHHLIKTVTKNMMVLSSNVKVHSFYVFTITVPVPAQSCTGFSTTDIPLAL